MSDLLRLAHLFWGTIVYRPYVYAFFACFLVFAWRQLRPAGCAAYIGLAYLIAFGCEYSSTRNGFPFGIYEYYDFTRSRELWVSNVPFWDSLSFVFLSYFSWFVAALLRREADLKEALIKPSTAVLAGGLMMLLDIVIDPLTLLGDRWFLGKIYYYPAGGAYFGVTVANFVGWWFVGSAIVFAYQRLAELPPLHFSGWEMPSKLARGAVFGVYAAIFVFNLGITAWIGAWSLFLASMGVAGLTLSFCSLRIRRRWRESSVPRGELA